jgi:hypothetical protein
LEQICRAIRSRKIVRWKRLKLGDEAATSTQDTGTENALAATQESLDKVRDILFGEQARDQERRYHDLESKFTGELEILRQESQRRLASIETLAKTGHGGGRGAVEGRVRPALAGHGRVDRTVERDDRLGRAAYQQCR